MRVGEGGPEGMPFAFSLMKLISGYGPDTTFCIISLMSTDGFPGGWKYACHLGLVNPTPGFMHDHPQSSINRSDKY